MDDIKCSRSIQGITIHQEIDSNDFGPFCIKFVEFESNFVVAGTNNFERFEFLVCLGFLCCVLWLVFTGAQTQQGHTAQSYYRLCFNVVVSLTIHDMKTRMCIFRGLEKWFE